MIDMKDLYVVCRVITGGLVSCDLLDVEEKSSESSLTQLKQLTILCFCSKFCVLSLHFQP
jgi:hypothetical protein